jgi:hypothetical protein
MNVNKENIMKYFVLLFAMLVVGCTSVMSPLEKDIEYIEYNFSWADSGDHVFFVWDDAWELNLDKPLEIKKLRIDVKFPPATEKEVLEIMFGVYLPDYVPSAPSSNITDVIHLDEGSTGFTKTYDIENPVHILQLAVISPNYVVNQFNVTVSLFIEE